MDESRCPFVWAVSLCDNVMESDGACISGALRSVVSIPSALKNIGLLKFVESISLPSSGPLITLGWKKIKSFKNYNIFLLFQNTILSAFLQFCLNKPVVVLSVYLLKIKWGSYLDIASISVWHAARSNL